MKTRDYLSKQEKTILKNHAAIYLYLRLAQIFLISWAGYDVFTDKNSADCFVIIFILVGFLELQIPEKSRLAIKLLIGRL